jgi:hypothetical protein
MKKYFANLTLIPYKAGSILVKCENEAKKKKKITVLMKRELHCGNDGFPQFLA